MSATPKKKAQLLIVYGRRRAGKTELLKEFARDKAHTYCLANLASEKEQLAEFTERIKLFSRGAALADNPFADGRTLFAYRNKLAQNEPLVVIIVEFKNGTIASENAESNSPIFCSLQRMSFAGIDTAEFVLALEMAADKI